MRSLFLKFWKGMTRTHKRTPALFLFFVLVGIAAALGLTIFKGPASPKIGAPGKQSLTQQEKFTADEKALLKTPKQGASETEKAAHFTIVNRLSMTAEFLDLSACYGSPLSFRVVEGRTVTVKNNDTVAHTIQISPEYIYTVPAKGEKKVIAQFGKGPGVYGYGCDDSPDARGVLFVTK